MVNKKITALCALTTTASCDVVPIVDITCPASTKKISISNIIGASTATFTNKTFDANGSGNSLSNVDLADLSTGAKTEAFILAASDETTDLTACTDVAAFRMPYAFTVTEVRASLTCAATGCTLLTVDIHESGVTIMACTKLTFDASETTTTTATTAAVVSDTSLADDAEITIDIDAIGSTSAGKGLKVYIIGYQT
jgi:hypothetical protein